MRIEPKSARSTLTLLSAWPVGRGRLEGDESFMIYAYSATRVTIRVSARGASCLLDGSGRNKMIDEGPPALIFSTEHK